MIQPRVDRAGRYVGITLDAPNVNGAIFWDWQANSVVWVHPGDPAAPFAHIASLKRRWLGVQWNEGPYPPPFYRIYPDVPSSAVDLGTGATLPANATQVHGSGNWIQNPTDLRDQWAVFLNYGGLVPTGTWLAPGGMVLMTENGQRRLLGHSYNTTTNYALSSFAKFSPDGNYVLFTSDMNGSPRSDVFLAELPTSAVTATPPTVSLTVPANGATVSGPAVAVAATASGAVPIAGVQFTVDSVNLGAELTVPPYTIAWNTATTPDGVHTLGAVARNTVGQMTAAAPVTVTVNNAPPLISSVAASSITASGATITWTTNVPSDSQVAYGLTMVFGTTPNPSLVIGQPVPFSGLVPGSVSMTYQNVTPLNPSLVTAHAVTLSGLAPGTVQHYQVRSRNAAGNLTPSPDFTFTTPVAGIAAPTTAPPTASPAGSGAPLPSGGGVAPAGGAPLGAGSPSGSGGGTLAPLQGPATTPSPGSTPDGLVSATSETASSGASDPLQGFGSLMGVPTPARPQAVVWGSLVNATASGNSLMKSSGCDGCADAGALSQQQIASGDGYLEFTASETSSLRTVGFKSRSPGADTGEMQHAMRLKSDRVAEVRERGMVRTVTTYVRGDVFRIAIVAGGIRYYKNGRLLYISGLSPAFPLVVSASLQDRGATVTNAIIAGRLIQASAPPADTVQRLASRCILFVQNN
jgi:hypothetical protein